MDWFTGQTLILTTTVSLSLECVGQTAIRDENERNATLLLFDRYGVNMEEQNNVKIFPMKCAQCKREIVDGMIYYHDKEKGFICEYCPGFAKGRLEVIEGGE